MMEARVRIDRRLHESPSLKAKLAELMTEFYEDVRMRAARQMGLMLETFPAECPRTIGQVMDEGITMGAARGRPRNSAALNGGGVMAGGMRNICAE